MKALQASDTERATAGETERADDTLPKHIAGMALGNASAFALFLTGALAAITTQRLQSDGAPYASVDEVQTALNYVQAICNGIDAGDREARHRGAELVDAVLTVFNAERPTEH